MRKNFVPKYRYYTNGENVVVAVASYAGRTIRGVAKCSDQDEFDLETGKKLAAARCAMKIEPSVVTRMSLTLKLERSWRPPDVQ